MTIPLRPARGRRRRPNAADHLAPYRWRPGQAGGGHGVVSVIHTLATQIRRTSGEGAELVAFYFKVLRGETFRVQGSSRTLVPNMDHRIAAAQWLSDRAFGRARELIQFTGESTPEERVAILRRLSQEERDTLRTILGRALAGTDAAVDDGTPSAPAPPIDPPPSDSPVRREDQAPEVMPRPALELPRPSAEPASSESLISRSPPASSTNERGADSPPRTSEGMNHAVARSHQRALFLRRRRPGPRGRDLGGGVRARGGGLGAGVENWEGGRPDPRKGMNGLAGGTRPASRAERARGGVIRWRGPHPVGPRRPPRPGHAPGGAIRSSGSWRPAMPRARRIPKAGE